MYMYNFYYICKVLFQSYYICICIIHIQTYMYTHIYIIYIIYIYIYIYICIYIYIYIYIYVCVRVCVCVFLEPTFFFHMQMFSGVWLTPNFSKFYIKRKRAIQFCVKFSSVLKNWVLCSSGNWKIFLVLNEKNNNLILKPLNSIWHLNSCFHSDFLSCCLFPYDCLLDCC